MQDLTPAEFQQQAIALANEIGPKAQVYASVSAGGYLGSASGALHGMIYVRSVGDCSPLRSVFADTFTDLIVGPRLRWKENKERHAKDTVRAMALAIIRLSADEGVCSEDALAKEFDRHLVERHGVEAVTEACRLGRSGSFSIVSAQKADAA